MSRRFLLSVLLVLSVVPLLSAPLVGSQQFTTLTTMTTATIAMSSSGFTTALATTTQTTYSTMSGTLSATIQVNKPASSGCYANWYAVNSTGVPIHINYVAGQPFDVYLMTALQWGLWYISEGAVCPPPPQYYLAKTSISSSGSFDVTANPSGNPFVLVFLTQGPLVNPALALSMGPTVGLQTTTMTASFPVTTITIPYPATLTQTLTTYSIEQVPFLQANASWLIPVLMLAVAAIVTFILVAIALHRRRFGTTEPKVTELKPVVQSAEKATEKLFCINCGAELLPKSKFCDKCGSAQA